MAQRKKPSQKSPRGGKQKEAEKEISYWTPPAKPVESFAFRQKRDDPVSYYQPPKTPQEAIDSGALASTATKPKNWLPYHKRNWPHGSRPNPRYWLCMWGCDGVTVPVTDKEWPKVTHDYYCPYWECMKLFPEMQEDFEFKPWHRPPKRDGEPSHPPNDEWNQNEWTFREPAKLESALGGTALTGPAESFRSPSIFGDGKDIAQERTRSRAKSNRKDRGNNGGKVGPNHANKRKNQPNEFGFTISTPRQKPTR
jgi:hypothetical protein